MTRTRDEFRQRARWSQATRIKELISERNRLATLLSSGKLEDEGQIARARANLKYANWAIQSYKQGRRAR